MASFQPKFKCLTIDDKLKIIRELESEIDHNFARTAEKHNVSRSTVSRLWKNKEEFTKKHDGLQKSNRKRKKAFTEEDVDSALHLWLQHKNQQTRVNAPILKAKAEQLAWEMGRTFVPSDGWIQRFKERHQLRFKKQYGEKQSTDIETWTKSQLPSLLTEYSPDDIYNADETGIYYKGLPDRGYVYKNVTLSGGKKQNERLTVLCCANMSGTDKQRLVVIGKSKAPRGFSKDIKKLPVSYYNSANAWMTSTIFIDYIRAWDNRLHLQGRSILLLLDHCSAHPSIEDLTSIRIEFLPSNTKAAMQPMDQGIIRNFKCHYRSLLNNTIIADLDAELTTTASTVLNKITVLRAIYFMFDAWNKVTETTIKNCYRKAGFVTADKAIEDEADFNIPANLSKEEFEEFIDIDDELPTTGELSNSELVAAVLAQNPDKKDAEEEEVKEIEIQPEMPTNKDLIDSINKIQLFMDMNGMTSQEQFEVVITAVQSHVIS